MFNNIPTVDFSAFAAPIQKIVDLNTAVIIKALEEQQAIAKNLLSVSQARTKAALEIKDVDGFAAFVTEQSEITQSSFQELAESTQVASKDANAYFVEVQAILTESQETVVKAAPALKPITKKAV